MSLSIEDAVKVAAVCNTADGGCTVCRKELCDELTKAFPEIEWEFTDSETIGIRMKADPAKFHGIQGTA